MVDRVYRYERRLLSSTVACLLLSSVIIIYGQARGDRFSTLVVLGSA